MWLVVAVILACNKGAPLESDPNGDDSAPDDSGVTLDAACPPDADVTWMGTTGDALGQAIEIVDDLDADGRKDLAVSGQLGSLVCVVSSADEGEVVLGAERCWVGVFNDFAGSALAWPGDLDGDAVPDLAVGALAAEGAEPSSGAVHLIPGVIGLAGSFADADVSFLGERSTDYAGAAVVATGDVTGDGAPDLLIGAYGNDGGGSDEGKAYLVAGPVTGGTHLLSEVETTWVGGSKPTPPPHAVDPTIAGDGLGWALGSGNDIDGDGWPDVGLGATANDLAGENVGVVALFHAPISAGPKVLLDADTLWFGTADQAWAGDQVELVGDLDGDGIGDVVASGAMHEEGRVWVLPSAADGGTVSDARATFVGEQIWDQAGYSIAVFDQDTDGALDLAMGAPFRGGAAGRVYVVRGPIESGTHLLADSVEWFDAVTDDDGAGSAVAMDDLDGDGTGSLLYGSPFNDRGGIWAGAVCGIADP
jgi:hypothetical protein